MRTTYGVVWCEGEEPLSRGKLELLPEALRLDGLTGTDHALREIAYDDLAAVRVGRSKADRLKGHPALVLERHSGPAIRVAAASQSWVVNELLERLVALGLDDLGVVPLS
jgi:hypothetical protein